MKQLFVLMWRHLVVRLKRFIITPLELISPILLFLFIYCYKEAFDTPTHKYDSNNILRSDYFQLGPKLASSRIYYYPDTKWTHLIMNSVGKKLELRALATHPTKSVRGIIALPNNTDTPAVEIDRDEAVVIFENMDGEMWPSQLNYTIRMNKDFKTEVYEPLDGTYGAHQYYGNIYESFLALQWAIDSSYIELLSGDTLNTVVRMQEFPSIRRNVNEQAVSTLCWLILKLAQFSLVIPFILLMSGLMQERSSGVEAMIRMAGVSHTNLMISHFLNTIPAGLVYSIGATAILKATESPMIKYTSGAVLFVTFVLHYINVIALAFPCSYMTNNTDYATSLASFTYLLIMTPIAYIFDKMHQYKLSILTVFIPSAPLQWIFSEVKANEFVVPILGKKPFTISNVFDDPHWAPMNVFCAWLMFLVQAAILVLLAWYLNHVKPGPYGQAKRWYFLCKKSYWQKKVEPVPESEESEEQPISQDSVFFERTPADAVAGIKIINVTKVFPRLNALTNVSFDVLKGEITILLGHNGAGKTTLMNIITGLMGATRGQVLVNGLDTVTHSNKVRKQMGLCPQQNLFLPHLNVVQHVMFFNMLKGVPYKQARQRSLKDLESLGLKVKANASWTSLSGGMKRRLQLACALTGNADVLILDEPTSGLDVDTRRELWNLLLSIRAGRTVLITTHFMEEADALGDRVLALHAGRLRCNATPMQLKRAIGTGYRLSLTTIGEPKEEEIRRVVQNHVAEAALKDISMNSVTYGLPSSSCSKFPAMFADLEANRSALGINSIGIGASTLEEVFFRLCSDVDTKFKPEENAGPQAIDSKQPSVKKPMLYFRQAMVLFNRQIQYHLYKKYSFLIFQCILPIAFIVVFVNVCNNQTTAAGPRVSRMTLDMYTKMADKRVLIKLPNDLRESFIPFSSIPDLKRRYSTVEFEPTNDVEKAVLTVAEKNLEDYNKYLVGLEVNDTDNIATVYYTTIVRHAAPIALNLYSKVIASKHLRNGDNPITTYNSPVEGDFVELQSQQLVMPKDVLSLTSLIILVLVVNLTTLPYALPIVCKERLTGSRKLHIMTGCSPVMRWITTLIWHCFISIVTVVAPILLCFRFLDQDQTLNRTDYLLSLLVIMVVGNAAFTLMLYVISFRLRERSASIVATIIIFLFGLLSPLLALLEDTSQQSLFAFVTIHLGMLTPAHHIAVAFFRAAKTTRMNALCDLNRHMCPNLIINFDPTFKVEQCCLTNGSMETVFGFSGDGVGWPFIYLVIFCVLYFILILLLEDGFFHRYREKFYKKNLPRADQNLDEMVRGEDTYVEKAVTLPEKQIQDSMLAFRLQKRYRKVCRGGLDAVKGISFSVKKGECFGLLGANGAGKSTTFKMLTAEECTSSGEIFSNGHFLHKKKRQYLHTIGYSQQHFNLDDFLTGRQNLDLLLTLRGFSCTDVKEIRNMWIGIVGLEKYASQRVSGYSGGCQRRLGAAAALCCGCDVTLLDEPTGGVDVGARRRLWAALSHALHNRRACVISSHSMDEMEALCDRIAIMAAGAVRCLGAPAALRAAHAAGHALRIKLNRNNENLQKTASLKIDIRETFNCTLQDEHQTTLHYHIDEVMAYSVLFGKIEEIKAKYSDVIEDYVVTETTLEEVFLSYAKDKSDSPNGIV